MRVSVRVYSSKFMSGWRVLSLPQWSWSADIKQKIDGEPLSLSLLYAQSRLGDYKGAFLHFLFFFFYHGRGQRDIIKHACELHTRRNTPTFVPSNKHTVYIYAPHTPFLWPVFLCLHVWLCWTGSVQQRRIGRPVSPSTRLFVISSTKPAARFVRPPQVFF